MSVAAASVMLLCPIMPIEAEDMGSPVIVPIDVPTAFEAAAAADSCVTAMTTQAQQDLPVEQARNGTAGAAPELQTPSTDIVVTARPRGDPLRKVNAQAFAATNAVDEAITGPAALAYKRIVPDPVRSGLRNFFNNLHEPTVAVNYVMQLKPGKAAETVGRFAVNSTIGLAGLLDVAKRRPFGLPRRPNGFADTLGYYGVRPGAYLYLPLIGPTTVRDLVGGGVDRLLTVSVLHGPLTGRAYILSSGAVRTLDRRAEADDQVRAVRDSADPYESRRVLYMRKRQDEIDHLHGRQLEPASS